jgi:multiple sugar transport system substrate-binding protein
VPAHAGRDGRRGAPGGAGRRVGHLDVQREPRDQRLRPHRGGLQGRYPQITLDVQQAPDGYDDKLLARYAAGNPPDVLRLNDDYILGYKTRNLIAPLDGYVKASGLKRDDFCPAVYDFPVHEGKPYAWLLGANPRLIFSNADLFRTGGLALPPATWEPAGWGFDDLVETARKLTRTESAPGVYGASLYDDTGNEQTFSINNGSPTGIYSKDGQTYALAVGAKHPDNGWRLLSFFTDEDAARVLVDNGYVIPAKAVVSAVPALPPSSF